MKILHVIHQFAPHFVGGTELYTAGLAAEQINIGHEVAVFVPTPDAPPPEKSLIKNKIDGTTLFQVPVGPRSGAQVFKDTLASSGAIADGFEQTLADFRPDVVHIQHLMGLPIQAIGASLKQSNIKFVITLHDFWWVCANAQRLTNYDQTLCAGPGLADLNCGRCAAVRGGRSEMLAPALAPLMGWRNRLLRPLLQRADTIFAATQFVADWHHGKVPLKRPIEIIPLGIDTSRFDITHKTDHHLTHSNSENEDGLNLLYVGGLSPQKGVHIIVQAVSQLGNKVQLRIIGDETKFTDYVARLKENATPNIQFLGKQSAATVAQAMASADMLLIPALWYETFVLVLSEAFACELPVMVSDIGALAERVTNGVDGIKVKPGDVSEWQRAIQTIADNKELLQSLKTGSPTGLNLSQHANEINPHLVKLIFK